MAENVGVLDPEFPDIGAVHHVEPNETDEKGHLDAERGERSLEEGPIRVRVRVRARVRVRVRVRGASRKVSPIIWYRLPSALLGSRSRDW